jgi:hypothetical protein
VGQRGSCRTEEAAVVVPCTDHREPMLIAPVLALVKRGRRRVNEIS